MLFARLFWWRNYFTYLIIYLLLLLSEIYWKLSLYSNYVNKQLILILSSRNYINKFSQHVVSWVSRFSLFDYLITIKSTNENSLFSATFWFHKLSMLSFSILIKDKHFTNQFHIRSPNSYSRLRNSTKY